MQVAIRNGTVVTSGTTVRTDLGIDSGRIVQIGGAVPSGELEIDAAERLVLPGGVDVHTHLAGMRDDVPADDFERGSHAALAGGVTTVCDFADQYDGEGLRPAIARAQAHAARSLVDFTFHVVLRDPNSTARAEITEIAEDGYTGLKFFMVLQGFAQRVVDYLSALRIAGRAGLITAVHAEDHAIVSYCTQRLLQAGRHGVEWYAEGRPPISEEIAVRTALALARIAEAPMYFVHLSSRGALAALREARAEGLTVYGETRPIYLFFTRAQYRLPDNEGAKFVGNPPLRDSADVEAVWAALSSGELSMLCSDHVGRLVTSKKDPKHTFATIPPGMPNLETLIPMLHSEGVRKGRISLPRMVEIVSTNPARLVGLAPRKGAIQVGADADLVIFNPQLKRTIRASEMKSASDFDPFEGWEVTGWPTLTLSRGEVVFKEGEILGRPGRGEFVPRSRFSPL